MTKKSKSFTPLWVWVIIVILLIQLGKLGHRNDWFKNKKTIKKEMTKEEIDESWEKIKKLIEKRKNK